MLKIVRCPETGQLELVEYLETPIGSLIHRCTHFQPACGLKCTRGCASQPDQVEGEGGPVREREGRLELETP